MLDLIGAIAAGAAFAMLAGTIAVYLPADLAPRWLAGTVLWAAAIVTVAALGGFAPDAPGSLPTPGFAFIAILAALFGTFRLSARFRSALLSIPLPVLVGLNIARIGGVFFLLLLADQRAPSPFAPSAGWGDIITGVVAIPLTLALARNAAPAWSVKLWNAFGTLDLIVAVALGILSAPTPFQVFTAAPGTAVLTSLPWILIPTVLVPIFLLLHLVIAAKIRSAESVSHTRFVPST